MAKTAEESKRQPGPESKEQGWIGLALGRIEDFQVGRYMEPGGDGRVVEDFSTVFASEPMASQDRMVADSEMVMPDADRVVLATEDRAVPHQREIGEPADRIRVPVG